MQEHAKNLYVQDSWRTPRNARTLQAYMALKNREIGARIAELRKSRGNPPQEVVAHKLEVAYRSYQSWEAGDTKPSWRNLTKLAKFYDVTEEFILLGEQPATAEPPTPNPFPADTIDGRLDRIEETLKFQRVVNGNSDALDARFDRLERTLQELQVNQRALLGAIRELRSGLQQQAKERRPRAS